MASRRLASAGRLARAVFPLTVRGCIILPLSATLLVVGSLRADLAALFWGAGFLLFCAYALVGGHLIRFALARRQAAGAALLSVTLPSRGLAPTEKAEALAQSALPRAFAPGFAARFSVPLRWHDRRITTLGRSLPPGADQWQVPFTAAERGVYRSNGAVLEVRDVLGLTSHRLIVAQEDSLTVFPRVTGAEELSRFLEQAEDSAVWSRRRRRSDDLLEARKYYPGDDMRRLNWKVFAHLDELFLRVGEEVPPPESRVLCVLDTTANPLIPRAYRADYLDELVETVASLMTLLAARGVTVLLSLPGMTTCRSFEPESLPLLLAILSDAWWTDAPWTPALPASPVHVLVFSTPGSHGVPAIMTAVNARGWGTSLLIKGASAPPPVRLPRLRDLLFMPAVRRGGSVKPDRKESVALAEAMRHDLSYYQGLGGKVRHAAEI
jgi:uncharacterized protein (DUF58 family)